MRKLGYRSCGFAVSRDLSSIYYETIIPKKLLRAPWVVFIHGLGGNLTSWMPVAQQCAAAGYRCLLMDMRGHGRSRTRMVPSSFSMEKYYEDIDAVIDAVGARRFILCGISSGAMVALGHHCSSRQSHERRASGLVLVSASSVSPLRHFIIPLFALRGALRSLCSIVGFLGKPLRVFGKVRIDYARLGHVPEWRLFFHDLLGTDVDGYYFHLGSVLDFDVSSKLHKIQVPVLLVTGSKDWVIHPSASVDMAKRIRHARLVHIGGMNHEGIFKSPQKIFSCLAEFLARNFSHHSRAQ